MKDFPEFRAHLAGLHNEAEIAEAIKIYFDGFGIVCKATRFMALGRESKRCFLVRFADSSNALKVANHCRLRSFAFDGALLELG